MFQANRYYFSYIILIIVCVIPASALYALRQENPVLIISSYNPDASSISANINQFMEEYTRLGGTNNVLIENMNCRTFSEAIIWKKNMELILDKYRGDQLPSSIILLGQEAWASFLSQNDSTFTEVPILCAMASKNGIVLPDDSISLEDWMPESVDFVSGPFNYNLKGGFVYEYDIKGNINFLKTLYPDTENVVFISDNSYGGVSLQALVRKEMKNFPELNLILLDGRINTIYTLVEHLRNIPNNSVIVLGTWRVDKNDGYFMRNATYSMMEANPYVPAISLSTIGFGYWAIGGIMPQYRTVGADMARHLINIQANPQDTANHVVAINNKLRVDIKKAKELHIDLLKLPLDTDFINQEPSFYEVYKYQIWGVGTVLLVLSVALFVVFVSYRRTKRLKDDLEISEKRLRIAKDRAEESNRLKSTFIANMSHEIRTPLNSIVGFANVLSMGDTPKEEAQAYSEIIQSNSDLLLRLINDILDMSRLETGKVIMTYEKCEVIQLSKQTMESVSYSRKSDNKFIFKTELSEYEIDTDPQRLQQVLINLISNAIKFTSAGTITLEIELGEDNEYMIFSVTDTGTGIPADKHALVFERFEKLNEHKQGTGLGLSISKLIVEKLGGNIWIDPDYHEGARFMFTHPIKRINNDYE